MNKCPVCKAKWPCRSERAEKMTERKMLHIYANRQSGMTLMELSNIYGTPMWRLDEILEHVKEGFGGK